MSFSVNNQKYQQFMKLQDLNLTKASKVINNQKFCLHFNENKETGIIKMEGKTRKDRLLMKMEIKAGMRAAQNQSDNKMSNYQTSSGFLPAYVNKFSDQFTSVHKTPWKFRKDMAPTGLINPAQVKKLQMKGQTYHSTTARQSSHDTHSKQVQSLLSNQRHSFEKLKLQNRKSENTFNVNNETTQQYTNASESMVNFKSNANFTTKYDPRGFRSTGILANINQESVSENDISSYGTAGGGAFINIPKQQAIRVNQQRRTQKVYDIIDNLKTLSDVKKLKLDQRKQSSSLDVLVRNKTQNTNSNVKGVSIKPRLKFDTSIHQLESTMETNFTKRDKQGLDAAEIEKQFAKTVSGVYQSGKAINSNSTERGQKIKMYSYKTPMESQMSIIQNLGMTSKKIPQLSKKKENIVKETHKVCVSYTATLCQNKALDHNISECASNKDGLGSHSSEDSTGKSHDLEKKDDYNKKKIHFNKQAEKAKSKESPKEAPNNKRGAMMIHKSKTANFHSLIGVQNDEIHIGKYFLKENIPDMIEFLDKQTKVRNADNIVEHTITEVSKYANLSREQIEHDVQKFKKVGKRNQRKRELEKPDPEVNRLCSVNEIAKHGRKLYPVYRNEEHEHDTCDHTFSEDDKIMLFLKSYSAFVQYQDSLNKCKTDKLVSRSVFGKFQSNPFLQIMQEIHDEDSTNKNKEKYEKISKEHSFQTKKNLRISTSAKRFLNDIHKQVNNDIIEIQSRLDANGEDSKDLILQDDTSVFSKMTKNQLYKKLSQLKHMLPAPPENKSSFKIHYFDKIHYLKSEACKQKVETVEQHNRNTQEIFRLEFIEETIRNQIKSNQKPIEQLIIKDSLSQDDVDQKHLIAQMDEQIYQGLIDTMEKSSKKYSTYLDYKKMLFVPYGIPSEVANGESPRARSMSLEEDVDGERQAFKERDQTSAFYDVIQQNKGSASKEKTFYKKSKWASSAVQPYYKYIKNNKFKLQSIKLNMGYAEAIADVIEQNEDLSHHLLEIHLDENGMQDDQFAIILESIRTSHFLQPSIQKISYTNNIIGPKSIRQLDKILSNGNAYRSLKELDLLNVLNPNDATALSDLHLLSEVLLGKQLQQLKLQKMNLNDDKFVFNMCQFIEGNQNLRNLKLSQCQLQPKQVCQIVKTISVREQKLYDLDISGNYLITSKGLQNDTVIQEIVTHLVSIITLPLGLQVLNLQGMGFRHHILTLSDAVQKNTTLRMIDFSANQLNHLDEEYIQTSLQFESDDFFQRQFFENDKYFLKTWEKFCVRHMQGIDEEISSENRKARIINQSLMKELKKEKMIEASSVNHGRLNEVGIIANRPQESIVLRRDVYNSDFIYNQIGHDMSETNDFNKPVTWRKCMKNDEEPQNCEYVMMIIEYTDIFRQMDEITDPKTIEIFQKMYQLSTLITKEDSNVRQNPIIFGSITNWKPIQALKLYQYVTAVSSQGAKERHILEKYTFDSVNYPVQKYFTNTYNNLFSTFQKIVDERQPMMVGFDLGSLLTETAVDTKASYMEMQKKFRRQSTKQQDLMKGCYIFTTYAPPGRHSIFVYDPIEGTYYQKIIVVEVKSLVEQQKYWMDPFNPTLKIEQLRKPISQYAHVTAFLADSRSDLLDLSAMHSDHSGNISEAKIGCQKHQNAFNSIAKYFQGLCALHKQILSEYNDNYPFISQSDLDVFFNNPENDYRKEQPEFACCKEFGEYQHEAGNNTGMMMNRSQFITAIVDQYVKLEKAQNVKDNLEGYVGYLCHKVKTDQSQILPFQDQQFLTLIDTNKHSIRNFMQQKCEIYGFPPKRAAHELIKLIQAEFVHILSDKMLIKWYIESKSFMSNEHTDWSKCQKYSVHELVILINKITVFLLNQENHADTKENKVFLKKYEALFLESNYNKFKKVLGMVLRDTMIDPDEPEKKVLKKKGTFKKGAKR